MRTEEQILAHLRGMQDTGSIKKFDEEYQRVYSELIAFYKAREAIKPPLKKYRCIKDLELKVNFGAVSFCKGKQYLSNDTDILNLDDFPKHFEEVTERENITFQEIYNKLRDEIRIYHSSTRLLNAITHLANRIQTDHNL